MNGNDSKLNETEETINLFEDYKNLLDKIKNIYVNIQEYENKINSINVNDNEFVFKRVVHLNEGEGFGELALIDSRRGKRAARITCTQKSVLAAINA